ncbi:MAG TPA: tetratricopeptide repeat protein [Candidatus Angelobacter sp.]
MKSMRLFFAQIALLAVLGSPVVAQNQDPSVAPPAPVQRQAVDQARPQKFPVTTASEAAARYFETGMVHFENHRWNFALRDWQEAVELDPKFALAYTWICFTTTDPAEESEARSKAKATMSAVTPPEQLMVKWITGAHENNYVAAIQAMNDLVSAFPKDKRLNFLAGYWLYRQDEFEHSKKPTLQALADDPNYATAYNQLGYLYSRTGDYPKALEALAKYVQLLPNEPNPHDSYAEVLRLSGRFDAALEHYRMALKIDPTFYISQKELGETYSLMGQEETARAEYMKAIHDAPSSGLKAEYLQKLALTWIRENKLAEADKAYLDAAEKARTMEQWVWRARAYRIMAMYQPDPATANKDLDQADAILTAKKDSVAKADLEEEHARILRVRVERNLPASPKPAVQSAAADAALAELQKMASSSASVNIQRTYSGAQGALLMAQQKYKAAIPYLEEDYINPLSMRLLVQAYRKTKATANAALLTKKLLDWKIPTIEEALAVPAFRAQENTVTAQN